MYTNLNAILLAAAVVTAAPFPSNSTFSQRSTESSPPAHWTNGSAPTNSTRRLTTFGTEDKKCKIKWGRIRCVPDNNCLQLLDLSGECTFEDKMDFLRREARKNPQKIYANVTSESATGGYAVGCDDKVAYHSSTEKATASGGCQNDGDDKIFSRSVKGCNFKGFEECKARGGEECGKELDKHGECTIDEFHDYLLDRGHKNEKRPIPKRPVSGNQTDSDADVFFNNVEGCEFKPYEKCKAPGSNHNDCIKELIKHAECNNWEILHKHLTESLKRIDGDWAVDGDGKLIITNSTVSEDATRIIVIDDRYGPVFDGKIVYSDDA